MRRNLQPLVQLTDNNFRGHTSAPRPLAWGQVNAMGLPPFMNPLLVVAAQLLKLLVFLVLSSRGLPPPLFLREFLALAMAKGLRQAWGGLSGFRCPCCGCSSR